MKKTKITALALGIVASTMAFSGCTDTEEKNLEYINVSDLANVSNPEIPPIVFNGSETETSNYTSKNTDTSDTESNIGGNISSTESDTSSSTESGTSSSSESDTSSRSEALPSDNSSSKTELEIPTSGNYYSAVAEPMKYDVEKVKSIFFGNTDVTDNTQYYSDQEPIYMWKNEDKELCVSNDDAVLEYTSGLSTLINIIFSPPQNKYKGNVDLFTHIGDNLDFCTRDEAVKTVRNILSDIGISVSEKANVYAFCQSDMQSVVNEECAKGEFYQFDDEWQRIPVTSYTVLKNQECYYISFNADWNNIPIYNNTLYYMTIKNLAIFHPTITAIYSAEGLVGLKVSEYRSVVHQGEKISLLISPETAAKVVGEKYKDVVGIERISIDKMSLMYVLTPISENGKINLNKTNMTPAWVCTVKMTENKFDRETGTQVPEISQIDVLVDAQSGLEII